KEMIMTKPVDVVNHKDDDISKRNAPSLLCSYRIFIAFLMFIGIFLCYAQRNGLSGFFSLFSETWRDLLKMPNQVIRWSKQTRGLILGSFYAGYILTQVASGIIGLYIGPRIFYSFIVCLSSLCTILVPIIAKLHPSVMVLSRIIMGAAQGCIWPTLFRLNSFWVPAEERTVLFSFPRNGVSGILWSVIWYILSSDTPQANKFMSTREKDFIQMCKNEERLQDTKTKIPWISILRSKAFWATMIGMFFYDCGGYAIWNVVPEYMNEILLFPVNENGIYSALPHITQTISVFIISRLADYIIEKKWLKRANTRKMFQSIVVL
ncbi:unnamed protein product, partial [Didymodactylos carnosus]